MQETVYRRYKDYEDLPDLIIIDGGKGQLNAALHVIRGLGLDIQVISLAEKNEEIFLEGQSESIYLERESPALHVIQHIRDEAHRFAITYHRKRLQRKIWCPFWIISKASDPHAVNRCGKPFQHWRP